MSLFHVGFVFLYGVVKCMRAVAINSHRRDL